MGRSAAGAAGGATAAREEDIGVPRWGVDMGVDVVVDVDEDVDVDADGC